MSEVEHLDLGADRPAGPPRRFLWALVAAAAVVSGSAFVVDRELRHREVDQVAACAHRVSAAVDFEGRRVRATYQYVRSAVGLVDAQGQLEEFYLLIAGSARRSGAQFHTARDMCMSIAVLPNHGDLRDRRDRCVEVLDAQRSQLAAVAADGRSVAEWLDAPRTC